MNLYNTEAFLKKTQTVPHLVSGRGRTTHWALHQSEDNVDLERSTPEMTFRITGRLTASRSLAGTGNHSIRV